jgi:hypothetical protein
MFQAVLDGVPPICTPSGSAAPDPVRSMLIRGMTVAPTASTCAGVGSGHGSPGVGWSLDPAGAAPLAGGAVAVVVELLAAVAGAVGSRLGRWFAFVLLACTVVCCNRLYRPEG